MKVKFQLSKKNCFIGVFFLFFIKTSITQDENLKSKTLAADLDTIRNEEYPDPLESAQPDDVDNDVIDKLVEHFLNKGNLNDYEKEKSNKEALKLVNSSSLWNNENLQAENSITNKSKAIEWLKIYLTELEKVLHQVAVDAWNYFTLASPISKQNLDEAEEIARKFLKTSVKQARQFNLEKIFFNDSNLNDYKLQMQFIIKEGMNALNNDDIKNYNLVLYNINQIYTKNPICDILAKKNNPCIYKFTDLPSLIQNFDTEKESLKWWLSWRQTAGSNLTKNYIELVKISNKGAQLNNHKDLGEMWKSAYNTKDFDLTKELEVIYQQILPFYEELHAYFRPRLAAIFQDTTTLNDVTQDGPLPIHLLSFILFSDKNLNGENWVNHYDLTKPFFDETIKMTMTTKNLSEENLQKTAKKIVTNNSITENLNQSLNNDDYINYHNVYKEILTNFKAQNYTVKTMFTKVYRYMKYLGFETLPSTMWSKSIFSKNWSKDMICDPATAYDMYDGVDYRIKICAQLTEQDFVNAHKLIVQLYYKFLSRKQSVLLRDAPNPSLSCAISSAFGILAQNLDYLKALELVNMETNYSEPYVINKLYKEALENFVELPFFLIADKWRYFVFQNDINQKNWSDEWWKLREEYQGIKKPSIESIEKILNTTDETRNTLSVNSLYSLTEFDAVSSPEITLSHAPAAKNFVCYVLQFQILKSLCPEANVLSQGCIPSKKQIQKIVKVMSQGASISWVDVMEEITGSKNLDANPLLEYFEPLISWLKNSNKHENVVIGWKDGKGKIFTKDKLPELKKQIEKNQKFILQDEQFAYPGQSCSNGQECLLDSICNNTICVCKEGLFTLTIADTYNCVPGNPANAGFADESGNLVIALNPYNSSIENSTMGSNKTKSLKKVENLFEPANLALSLKNSKLHCLYYFLNYMCYNCLLYFFAQFFKNM